MRAWQDSAGLTWIDAAFEPLPDWTLVRCDSPAEVDALTDAAEQGRGHCVYWSWIDEAVGRMRVRAFAPDFGVPEDEATGSAALRLVELLGRTLEIHQGKGSMLRARPLGDGRGAVGGVVAEDPPVALP